MGDIERTEETAAAIKLSDPEIEPADADVVELTKENTDA